MSTTTLERKAFTAEVKAAEDGEPGSFTGYAAIFGNVDSFGDVMDPASFNRTLSERGLPMLAWMHEWDLVGPIGVVGAAIPDEKGLRIDGRLFIESDLPSRVYQSMKAGQVREMSFAFKTVEASDETRDGETVRIVKDVDLYEVSLVLVGANPETEVIDVRSQGPKVGSPEWLKATAEADADFARALDELAAERQAEVIAEAERREYLHSLTVLRASAPANDEGAT